ncbi:GroES-like protein [Xylariaceae sp. FL0804]|nr:GroES-like protein [Xylariaceae sp. FL0804]
MAQQPTFHDALVTVAARAPYEVRRFPTVAPAGDEITLHVLWTASTPLDLHQADGGLLVEHPMRTGSTGAGIVVRLGPAAARFRIGDRVFGYAHRWPEGKMHQEFATAPEWVFGKVPDGFSLEQAVTLPENVVTAFHTISADLRLPTPRPLPLPPPPPRAAGGAPRVLIWGAASSVGQQLLQVLRLYHGHRLRLTATASPRHHAYLRDLGAERCLDYRSPDVVADLLDVGTAATIGTGNGGGDDDDDDDDDDDARAAAAASAAEAEAGPTYSHIVDCIGSLDGSLKHLARVAQPGATVAVMLPVILRHATADEAPEYSLDASAGIPWAAGVDVRGVRTHFYWKNEMFREKLLTEIIPELLASGAVRPNPYRVVEGRTLLKRASNALDLLRSGAVSGEKLVWRVSDRPEDTVSV